MKRTLLLLIGVLLSAAAGYGQHHHQPRQRQQTSAPANSRPVQKNTVPEKRSHPAQTKPATDTAHPSSHKHKGTPAPSAADQEVYRHDSGTAGQMHHGMSMSHAFSRSLPMNRNGSGTSWLPDASPMFGYMTHSKEWMFMAHSSLFLRYNRQDIGSKGTRGGQQWDLPDMLMLMGQRPVRRRGLFHFSTMFSLDNVFTGGRGYPLLFQSGETYKGEPLVDRQHPHDLFSELSASYSHAFSSKLDVFVYLGYPGEPAIGPVTFMHRPSGMDNPDAPLSHHWVDATHITFGVATAGIRYRMFKLEGSSFTGREPDEHRYGFDRLLFDSRSARLSFNPGKRWALQVSHAFLNRPEAIHPHDVYRTTASATYAATERRNILFNATALWGMNKVRGHDGGHAALLEASLRKKRLVIYGRYEWVQKSAEELDLREALYGHDRRFPVQALTLGTGYDLLEISPLRVAAGAQFSIYHTDPVLNSLYGSNPLAGELYLRLYPVLMR